MVVAIIRMVLMVVVMAVTVIVVPVIMAVVIAACWAIGPGNPSDFFFMA